MNVQFISRAIAVTKLALSANAPTIMVVGGVVSMGAGTVVACKKTLHIEEVLAKHTPMLENVEKGESLKLEGYTPEKAKSDRIKIYSRAGLDLGKLYAVPGVLFIGGAALVFGGHRIMLQRNATLAIAFTGLKKTFDAYRGRVVQQFGHEVDQGMLSGYHMKEFVDPDTGQTTTVAMRDWDTASGDPYNRVFQQGESDEWVNDLGTNKMFIHNQQRFAQERLNRQNYLYLSDVYQALGFEETDISRVTGWKVKRNPDGSRDIPFVDFGLDKALPDDWKYSKEKAIYLDFNCQGLIVGGKVQKILEQS